MKDKQQYLVIGLGRFGSAVATTLAESGMEVMALDSDMERVEDHRALLTHVVCGDAMDRVVLEQIGADRFDVVIVSIATDIKVSCMVTMLLKEMNIKHIVAKAADEFHGRMLEKLGATEVLLPERDMGRKVAHHLVTAGIMDYIELSRKDWLVEIIPKADWIGKSLKELELRKKENINVIAIRRNEEIDASLSGETVILEGDIMLVITHEER